MLELSQITELVDAIILPLIGLTVLLVAKFRIGDAARSAERQFLGILVVMTLVTMRTVIICDESWLLHTSTLGTLIVASLVIPSQEATVAI